MAEKTFSIREIQEMIAENCTDIMQEELDEADNAACLVEYQYLPKGRVEITADSQRFLITIEEV